MICDNVIGDRPERQVVVIFPFGGLPKASNKAQLFFQLLRLAREYSQAKVIVVIEQTTVQKSPASISKYEREINRKSLKGQVETHCCWSVDTCQLWLNGWGYAIRDHQPDRIIQLPGDLTALRDPDDFFQNKLDDFIKLDHADVILGDFFTGDPHSAKDLIDEYGTFPLMANWFPDIAAAIWRKRIHHPRTEFLNIKRERLEELLLKRKFAYEQTLNMLIQLWHGDKNSWHARIHNFPLGELEDEPGFRKYRECVNQIERMERMLKMLWREQYWSVPSSPNKDKILEFEHLDNRSNAIRGTAQIIIKSILEIQHP